MSMRTVVLLTVLGIAMPSISLAATDPDSPKKITSAAPNPGAVSRAPLPSPRPLSDPCFSGEIAAAPTPPHRSHSAQTTQCGVFEFDSGWLKQSFRNGSVLYTQSSSLRYGLGSRMDIRWALPSPIHQKAVGQSAVNGVSDQWFSARYRFLEQGAHRPAVAFTYGLKDPSASPSKGLGTGRFDHLLLLISSRDLGRFHLDFNTAGTLAGSARGHNGGALFGLVLSASINKKLTAMIETDGGSTPATTTRYGEALLGGAWTITPRFVLDAAYTRGYTAGAPRQQITVGCTYSLPRRIPLPAPHHSALARLTGR